MRLHAEARLCSGCRSCEVVCSLRHEAMVQPREARLRVEKEEERGLDTPVVCLQCDDAPCAAACPVDCIRRSPAGVWLVDEEQCTGCGACVDACEWKVIRLHGQRGVAVKCDMCGGSPECVAVCQLQALRLEATAERVAP